MVVCILMNNDGKAIGIHQRIGTRFSGGRFTWIKCDFVFEYFSGCATVITSENIR